MRVYRKSVDGGRESQGDEQIVSEGAEDATHQKISALLAGRTHPQGNHLCSCPQRDDRGSNSSLTEANTLSQLKCPLHDGWTTRSHGGQPTEGEQDRFPLQTRA